MTISVAHAELTLTLPETVWIGTLSRDHPDASFRVLAALSADGTGVGLVEVTAPDLPAVVSDFRRASPVLDVELLQQHDQTALLQFETDEPLLLLPVQESGVPLEMPFTIVEGEAVWEVTAPREQLGELVDQLDAFGIPFTIDRIGQRIEPEQLLTDRQRRLVQAAVENGYYDMPRECSLTELADLVGLAKSTCSETLHRAEGRIVKRFVEEMADSRPDLR